MPIFRVTVFEIRVYAVDRYVVATDDEQARQLAVANDWSSYNGLADGGEEACDPSIVSTEADDCDELTDADVAVLKAEWEADWTHLDHVEREQGPALFFAAVPPGEPTPEEEAAQDRHLYGI